MVFMKTYYELQIRIFPVKIRDCRTGEEWDDLIVIDKARLQAAQMVGQSSKELIERLYQKEGYTLLEVGKADKMTVDICLRNVYGELEQRMHLAKEEIWNIGGDRR